MECQQNVQVLELVNLLPWSYPGLPRVVQLVCSKQIVHALAKDSNFKKVAFYLNIWIIFKLVIKNQMGEEMTLKS